MKRKYLIIYSAILPEPFEKVLEAREMIESGKAKDVSEAARTVGISRSTYYKYKDSVFAPGHDSSLGKKVVLSFNLAHKTGALSEVLTKISANQANILTINQNLPIGGKAHITVSMETEDLKIDPKEIKDAIASCSGVSNVRLIAIE